jgi:hypothetical protein
MYIRVKINSLYIHIQMFPYVRFILKSKQIHVGNHQLNQTFYSKHKNEIINNQA